MSKYQLIGDYNSEDILHSKEEGAVRVFIPLKGKGKSLRYGIGQALLKLNANSIFPTEDGIDLLCLAGLIYLADTRISRVLHAQDSWTREIAIELPVFNREKWTSVESSFSRMLNFLTGDRWVITFTQRECRLSEKSIAKIACYDAVTLFSGGMDSLIGTINHLESHKRIALISHASDSHTKNAQDKLLRAFKGIYSDSSPLYLDLWAV